MPTLLVALGLLPLLAADAPQPAQAPPRLLPRSSIAAVLAHRGELGLDDAEVKRLEERDAALQKQVSGIRKNFAPPESQGQGRGGVSLAPRPPGDEQPLPPSPADLARGEGDRAGGNPPAGGGRHGVGHAGQREAGQPAQTRRLAPPSFNDGSTTLTRRPGSRPRTS